MLRRTIFAAVLLTVPAVELAGKEFDTPVETTYRQLTWDDFKSGDNTGGRWDRGAWAHVAAGIQLDRFRAETRVEDDGVWFAFAPGIEAYAVMDKFLSGVARGAKKDEVLAHEQLHFDVTEAFARRLTAKLLGLEGRGEDATGAMNDLQSRVQQAYDEAMSELMTYQKRYDSETRHGSVRKQQKRWSRQIGEFFAAATAELEAVR